MRPHFHISDTDSTLGQARIEMEQRIDPGKDSLHENLALEILDLLRRFGTLENEVLILKQRTWWSMLKEMFR